VKFTKSTKIKYKFFYFQLQSLNGSNNFLSNIKEKTLLTLIWLKMMKYVPLKLSNIMQFRFLEWVNSKLLDWLKRWLISMEVMRREFWFSVKKKCKLITCQKISKFKTNLYMVMSIKGEGKMLTEILRLEF